MAPIRVLVGLPDIPRDVYRPKSRHVTLKAWTLRPPPDPPEPNPSRRRRPRAAEGDLWWNCLRGGNCPWDIKNKYTQNTPADKILRWGSSAVYLGGLSIGTGSGAAGADISAGIAAGGPRVSIPSQEVPVRVEDVGAILPDPAPVDPGNTFVNPAFEGSTISDGSTIDSVLIGDPQPVPSLYKPLETGPLFYPAENPPSVPELEVPTRRGDSLDIIGDLGSRRVLAGTADEPPVKGPLEVIELVPLDGDGPRAPDVEYDVWVGGDVDLGEVPRASTPGPAPRVTEHTFENPAFDSSHIDELFRRGLQEYGVSEQEVISYGPEVLSTRGRTVTVSASGVARGIQTRSGFVLPRLFNLFGELSGIAGVDPGVDIELFNLEGGSGRTVDIGTLDTAFDGTQAWDGRGGIDTVDIEFDTPGFEDIPLDDPFPEMEVIEDDPGDGVLVGGTGVTSRYPMSFPLTVSRRGHQVMVPSSILRPAPKPSVPVPLPPYLPGVWVDFPIDPSLYWRRRRRRRRRAGSGLPYR